MYMYMYIMSIRLPGPDCQYLLELILILERVYTCTCALPVKLVSALCPTFVQGSRDGGPVLQSSESSWILCVWLFLVGGVCCIVTVRNFP